MVHEVVGSNSIAHFYILRKLAIIYCSHSIECEKHGPTPSESHHVWNCVYSSGTTRIHLVLGPLPTYGIQNMCSRPRKPIFATNGQKIFFFKFSDLNLILGPPPYFGGGTKYGGGTPPIYRDPPQYAGGGTPPIYWGGYLILGGVPPPHIGGG